MEINFSCPWIDKTDLIIWKLVIVASQAVQPDDVGLGLLFWPFVWLLVWYLSTSNQMQDHELWMINWVKVIAVRLETSFVMMAMSMDCHLAVLQWLTQLGTL